ncbi:MAG: phosphoenolpyruvate--protein phosphotransferase [Candidatus Delongbacteria bacterium]
MNKKKNNRIIKGVSVNPGLASGSGFLHKELDLAALQSAKLEIDSVDKELARLGKAVDKSQRQLKKIEEKLGTGAKGESSGIFNAQAMMLKDPGFLDNIRKQIIKKKVNIEYVISREINKIRKKFQTIKDPKLKISFMDIEDTYNRLIRNILDLDHLMTNPFKRLDAPVIMVGKNILPSDIAILDTEKILGFAIEEGSVVSHAAIIARTLGVPAVIRIPGITKLTGPGDRILVDGFKGEVVLDPAEKEIKNRKKSWTAGKKTFDHDLRGQECRTKNGEKIILEANIATLEDAQLAKKNGAEGVGLLRSEFFYMAQNTIPDPEKEIKFYKKVIDIFRGLPVTFRLLDIGSDKNIGDMPAPNESNPQMGVRGIRYLLKYRKIMRHQLRCLMAASRETKELRILLPFVTLKEDITRAKKIIKDVADKNSFDIDKLKVGIMVEIPSAALDMKNWIDNVDFISVGTNDLFQYIFAVSREDIGLDPYRNSSHPVMLKVLDNVIKVAEESGKPAGICGEMAGDPVTASILAGIGIRQLSMHPQRIPYVKEKLLKNR